MQPLAKAQLDAPSAIAWDECICPMCDFSEYAPLFESDDAVSRARFLVVRCNRCGLCFTNPRPDVHSMQPFYAADYRCHQTQESKARRSTDPFAKLLPPRGQARLLDFGCGGGAFIWRMHTAGWNVVGLDASETAIARIRERGLIAHVGTLPQPHWADASFDAITMWQSLEHTHQPLDTLREAHRLLAPDGTLLVAVPNFDGWGSRHFGADWFGLDVPRHLTHFTPDTLIAMVQRAGFTHIDLRHDRHNSWIRHSAYGKSGALASLLRTRLGSSVVGWWGKTCSRAEGLLVLAKRLPSERLPAY